MVEYNDNGNQEKDLSHITSLEVADKKIKEAIDFIQGRGEIEDKDQHYEELEDHNKFDVVLGELSCMLQSQIVEADLRDISRTLEKEGSQVDKLNEELQDITCKSKYEEQFDRALQGVITTNFFSGCL